MRISDWSSDVCSSDLRRRRQGFGLGAGRAQAISVQQGRAVQRAGKVLQDEPTGTGNGRRSVFLAEGVVEEPRQTVLDRRSVVEGKSVSVRVDLGGCSIS